MKDWLLNCFVPDAKWKCRQDGHEFKVLLIMDNCPAHAHYLFDLHPNVRVFFFTTTDDFHSEVFRSLRRSTVSRGGVVDIAWKWER